MHIFKASNSLLSNISQHGANAQYHPNEMLMYSKCH